MLLRNEEQSTYSSITVESPFFFIRYVPVRFYSHARVQSGFLPMPICMQLIVNRTGHSVTVIVTFRNCEDACCLVSLDLFTLHTRV